MIFIFLLFSGWAWLGEATAVGVGRARITHISHNGELGVAEPFRATTLTGHVVGLGAARAASARYLWLLEGVWHQGNPVTANFTQLGRQTVRLLVCTGSTCPLGLSQLSGSSSWSNSWCSSQRALCKEQTVLVQYVRRELRDLPAAEWKLFAETMVYLKNTPQAVLTERHGVHAISWDVLASKHLEGTLNTTCDHAHSPGSFLAYHRLLLRSWERSVQAVHPHLALPYWDIFYDEQLGDPSNSSIFSDEYMGTSGVASNGYMVTDGPFGYPNWPVPPSAGLVHERIYGPYGLMRSPTNLNNATHFTRRINQLFDWTYVSSDWPNEANCRICMESPNSVDLDLCIQERHSHTHLAIGGGWNAEIPTDGYSLSEQARMASQFGEAGEWLRGLLTCDSNCDLALGTSACVCYCNDTSHQVTDRATALQSKSTCSRGMTGDFYDVTNSVLDPLFPIYHTMWDKFWVDYQVRNVSLENLYRGYETNDTSMCASLDEILAGDTGFSLLNLGLSDTAATPSVTIRQSIDLFLPAVYGAANVIPYTYQTYSAWGSSPRPQTPKSLNGKTLRGQL